MSEPRRRILRTRPTPVSVELPEPARTQRQQVRLAKNRSALKRWMTRLKRATNAVAKLYAAISRL